MQLGSSVFRGYMNAPPSLWGPFRKEKEVNLPLHEGLAENSLFIPQQFGNCCTRGAEEKNFSDQTFIFFLQKPPQATKNWWEQQRIVLQTSPIQKGKRRWYQGSRGTALVCICERRRRKMSKPNYSGTFHMVEQDNMEEYLAALGGNLNIFYTNQYTVIIININLMHVVYLYLKWVFLRDFVLLWDLLI